MAAKRRDIPDPLSTFMETGQIGGYQAIQSSLYQVQDVPIDDIFESPYQTREIVSSERFQRLVKSMKEQGPQDYKDFIPVREHPTIPGKWQVARGGHTRLKAAKEAGLTTYPIVVVEYDNKRSAFGTARENLAREDLTPVEEGNLYLILRQEFGYTQEGLAGELEISRDRIKECEAVAKSAPDLLDMIKRAKELSGDANRGLRAAKYLRRLDALEKKEQGMSMRLRAPLIDAFLYERITTDGVDIATKRVTSAADPELVLAEIMKELNRSDEEVEQAALTELEDNSKKAQEKEVVIVPEIQRSEKLNLATRRFRQFTTLIGHRSPSPEERQVLTNMRDEIDSILSRS